MQCDLSHRATDAVWCVDDPCAVIMRSSIRFARLCVLDDALHHRHTLDRMCANRALCGEHERVRALPHGVGDVAGLSACRSRVRRHALEHLRRNDDRDELAGGGLDDATLPDRHFLRSDLNAKVATRDHHAVGHRDDLIELPKREGCLDLRDDGCIDAQ